MQGYETVHGVVARETDAKDSDRYLTLLTAEMGKMECYAKGIRSQKSKLAASAGQLTFGEFKLLSRLERRLLVSAKAVERFPALYSDIGKYACATHFLEIAGDVIMEQEPFPAALSCLLNALFCLAYRDTDQMLVARAFELRMLALAGYAPVLDRCSACGRHLRGEASRFDVAGAGLLCEGCAPRVARGRCVPVSPAAVRAMRHVVECEAGRIFSFALSDDVSRELAEIVPAFLKNQFGRDFPRLAEAERYTAFEEEARRMAATLKASAKTRA